MGPAGCYGSGCDAVDGSSCSVRMNTNRALTATFDPNPPMHALTPLAASSGSSYTVSWTCVSILCSNVSILQEARDANFVSPQVYQLIGSERSRAFAGKASGTYCYRVRSGSSGWSNTSCTSVTPECSSGQTRCVSGNINMVETCGVAGWSRSSCPAFSLCSDDACRTVCDLTSTPLYPSLCVVPNKDGRNDGEWFIWTADGKLAEGYARGGSTSTSGGTAPIYSSGLTWPYAWSLSSSSSAYVEFKLNQFGGTRKQRLSFRVKRSGILNQNTNNYLVGIFNGDSAIASCAWGPVPYSWATDNCFNGSPYNSQMNIVGYHGLAPTAVVPNSLPRAIRTGQPPDPLPCLLLGQLAVDSNWANRGIGSGLLKDALCRCLQGAALIGGRAVVVKAVDVDALDYWQRRGFVSSKDDRFTLYRSIDAMRASLREAANP